MNSPYRFWNSSDDIWEAACEEAAAELAEELDREPTDEEIEDRAHQLIQNSEPDWDAMIKDSYVD